MLSLGFSGSVGSAGNCLGIAFSSVGESFCLIFMLQPRGGDLKGAAE